MEEEQTKEKGRSTQGQPPNNLNIYLKHNSRVAQNISPVKRLVPGTNEPQAKQEELINEIVHIPISPPIQSPEFGDETDRRDKKEVQIMRVLS